MAKANAAIDTMAELAELQSSLLQTHTSPDPYKNENMKMLINGSCKYYMVLVFEKDKSKLPVSPSHKQWRHLANKILPKSYFLHGNHLLKKCIHRLCSSILLLFPLSHL